MTRSPTDEEVNAFCLIKEDSKISGAVVGVYNFAYQSGFRDGFLHHKQLEEYNRWMGWIAVSLGCFLSGLLLGAYL